MRTDRTMRFGSRAAVRLPRPAPLAVRVWSMRFPSRALAVALALAGAAVFLFGLPRPLPPLAAAGRVGPEACAIGSRTGPAGRDDALHTADGLPVSVRTPSDYDPTRAHPLLVVFPPAGHTPREAERFYGLTEGATARGYVVAYSAAVPLSRRALAVQSRVARTVADRWCIDADRLVFLGHSDGGSVAEGVVLRGDAASLRPQQLLASAAGLRGADLAGEACPPALRVTIVHGLHDDLFPDWGREAARWWAGCFACAAPARLEAAVAAGRCVDLGPCDRGGSVRYCEAGEPHRRWPRVADPPWSLLDGSATGNGGGALQPRLFTDGRT